MSGTELEILLTAKEGRIEIVCPSKERERVLASLYSFGYEVLRSGPLSKEELEKNLIIAEKNQRVQ